MDTILSIIALSPPEICQAIAKRARDARLAANLSQQGLASRAGVSFGSLKRFEQTGAASLEHVVRIAVALRLEDSFEELFQPPKFSSIDEVLSKPRKRQRGNRR